MEIPEHGQVALLLIRSCIPEAGKTTTQSLVYPTERKKVGGHKAWITFSNDCIWMFLYFERKTSALLPTPSFKAFAQMDSIPCHWGIEVNQTHRDKVFIARS